MFKMDFSHRVRLMAGITRYQPPISLDDMVASHAPIIPYCNDILFLNGRNAFGVFVASQLMRTKDVLGLPRALRENDCPQEHYTSKPRAGVWSEQQDYLSYGSLLGGLKRIATSVNNSTKSHFLKSNREVEHIRYNGNVTGSDLLDLYRRQETDGGYFPSIPLYGYVPKDPTSIYGGFLVGASSVEQYETLSFIPQHFPVGERVDYGLEALESVNTIVDAISVMGGSYSFDYAGFTLTYSNIVNESHIDAYGKYFFDIRYTYMLSTHWDDVITWDVHIKCAVSFRSDSGAVGIFTNGEYRGINPACLIIVDNSTVTPMFANHGLTAAGPLTDIGVRASWDIGLLQCPFFASSDGRDKFNVFAKNQYLFGKDISCNREQLLQEKFHNDIQNLRPSSYLAACDALDSVIDIVDANWLQNAQHLGDVLSMLPDLSSISEILAKINNGDLSVVLDLADYLADTILKWNFQQKPIIRDGREVFAPELLKSVRSLAQGRAYTAYGTNVYRFKPNDRYFGDIYTQSLITRAEIRFRIDLGTLCTGLLAANALGFLPSLERLWSLVPFSFVVDWFTNMSKRLHAVDDQLAFIGLSTDWCIYSYKVTCTPSSNLLEHFDLYDLGSSDVISTPILTTSEIFEDYEPFSLSVYKRELSTYMPRLVDSPKYDFLEREGHPNLWTVGSLLWKQR